MGEQQAVVRNRGYIQGVNNKLFAFDIQDQEAVELKNIDTSIPGNIKKRSGSELVATGITTGPIMGLSVFHPSTGISEEAELLAVSPNASGITDDLHARLWKWTGSGMWSEVGTLSGYTNIDEVSIVQHYDITGLVGGRHVVVMRSDEETGKNHPGYYYNGSSLNPTNFGEENAGDKTAHPSSAALESAFYRLFGSGSVGTRNAVFFSDVGSGLLTGFAGNQSFNFGGRSRGEIVALRQFRQNNLIVFMDDKIEVLFITERLTDATTGPDPFSNWTRDVIDPEIGCGSRRSIATVGQDILFVDQFGNVRSLARTIQDASQGSKSLPVSDRIQGTIDRINKVNIDKIAAVSFDRFYYVAFPVGSDTDPSEIWRFDVTRQAWDGPWTGFSPKVFTTGVLTSDSASSDSRSPSIYAGTNEESHGQVLALDRNLDDFSSAISFSVTTKRYLVGFLELEKRWNRLEVFAKGTADVDVTIEANSGGRGFETIGTMNVLGDAPIFGAQTTFPFTLGGTGVAVKKFNLEGLLPSRDIQFRFSADTDSDIQLLGFTMTAYIENFEWGEVTN